MSTRARVATRALLLAVVVQGCSCGTAPPSIDAGSDAGPLFAGIDASGYEVRDSGPRPPEPCAVPIRRLSFPVGDESLTHTNHVWAFGSHVWAYLGGFAGALPSSPPASMHLFDLESEREVDIDFALGDDEHVLGVFETPTGFELVVSDGARSRLVSIAADGRRVLPDQPFGLPAFPLVRLDDGRYVGLTFRGSVTSPRPATLVVGPAGGPPEPIALGFETTSGHLIELFAMGTSLVGIGYEDAASRMVRFEVDLDSGTVRLGTLIEGVDVGRALNGWRFGLWADGATATVGLTYERVDAPEAGQHVELLWWALGEDAVTQRFVRSAADAYPGVLALGGDMPRQTLVLAQSSGSRTWVTVARVRGPGDVLGGREPLGVFIGLRGAAAWEMADGTTALAFLSQHELEVVFLCEGAP